MALLLMGSAVLIMPVLQVWLISEAQLTPLAIGTASTILHLRSDERGECCSCILKLRAPEMTRLEENGNMEIQKVLKKKPCSCTLLPLPF